MPNKQTLVFPSLDLDTDLANEIALVVAEQQLPEGMRVVSSQYLGATTLPQAHSSAILQV
jgi:hypothetical protein